MPREQHIPGGPLDLAALRHDYGLHGLTETEADPDPFVQFARWMDTALAANLPEPNAMTLATATPDGRPSARMVLLRGFDERGFVFYTNYDGRKGGELAANPWAALVFYWAELERQIRIEGRVEQVAAAESDAYFAGRPEGSRLGAWASPQSRPIPDRAALENRLAEATARFAGGPIPRPPHWGGYRVTPDRIEFWQGRPSRLHDRLLYQRGPDGTWARERLAP
jgi:pyridoxamine 5'-phosphate oxidase